MSGSVRVFAISAIAGLMFLSVATAAQSQPDGVTLSGEVVDAQGLALPDPNDRHAGHGSGAVQRHRLARRQDPERGAWAATDRRCTNRTTVDLRAGLRLVEGLSIRIGVENLTNEFYATHINSLNPFTGQRIAEFGRSFYVGTDFGF